METTHRPCSIIARNVGVINRLKFDLPQSVLFTLYSTLVLSYINYGILAWGNASVTFINRLLVLQKKALRIIHFVGFRTHSDPLFLKHNTLKIHDIYNLQTGSFMFQFI